MLSAQPVNFSAVSAATQSGRPPGLPLLQCRSQRSSEQQSQLSMSYLNPSANNTEATMPSSHPNSKSRSEPQQHPTKCADGKMSHTKRGDLLTAATPTIDIQQWLQGGDGTAIYHFCCADYPDVGNYESKTVPLSVSSVTDGVGNHRTSTIPVNGHHVSDSAGSEALFAHAASWTVDAYVSGELRLDEEGD